MHPFTAHTIVEQHHAELRATAEQSRLRRTARAVRRLSRHRQPTASPPERWVDGADGRSERVMTPATSG